MSGSPIIQNGKLIGAVTHVLVKKPEEGYAVFGDIMIKQMKKGTNDIVSRMKDVSFSSKESYKNMTELENVLEEFKTKKEVEEAVDKVDEQNLITNAVSEELQNFDVVQDFLNSTNDNVASNTTSDIDFDLDSVEEYKA